MGTKIDELMNDVSSNSLNQNENSMVDSIINDINGDSRQVPSQHEMPQLSDEERQMLMKQQQHEQMMYEQHMRQQHMQQQQMQQQQQQQNHQQQQTQQQQMEEQQKKLQEMIDQTKETEELQTKETNILTEILSRSRETIIVFLLYLFFNLNVVQNVINIKGSSIFFDIQKGEPTIYMILLKSILIASVFFAIQSIVTK
jgi:Fe2+ transport system protein B